MNLTVLFVRVLGKISVQQTVQKVNEKSFLSREAIDQVFGASLTARQYSGCLFVIRFVPLSVYGTADAYGTQYRLEPHDVGVPAVRQGDNTYEVTP